MYTHHISFGPPRSSGVKMPASTSQESTAEVSASGNTQPTQATDHGHDTGTDSRRNKAGASMCILINVLRCSSQHATYFWFVNLPICFNYSGSLLYLMYSHM